MTFSAFEGKILMVTVTSEILVYIHDYNSYKTLLLRITDMLSLIDQLLLTTDRQFSRHFEIGLGWLTIAMLLSAC